MALVNAPPAAFQAIVPFQPCPMVITFIQPAATELTGFISPLSAYCIPAFVPTPSNHIAWALPGNRATLPVANAAA
ncbi:hypothetical protein OkiPb00165_47480 [Escherichia coli]